jgi:M6 family metalloprotease-like protein
MCAGTGPSFRDPVERRLRLRGAALRPFAPWAGILPLALSLLAAPRSAAAPLVPEAVDRLRVEGRLVPVEKLLAEARSRGVDAPGDFAPLERLRADPTAYETLRVAVLLVDFPDFPADTTGFPVSYYEDLVFGDGGPGGISVREYYLENSYGRFTLTGQVVGWLRMPEPSWYYADYQMGTGSAFPKSSQGLADHAVRAADGMINFSKYDDDGPDRIPDSGDDDGRVDAVLIIHSSPPFETRGDPNFLVSLTWHMITHVPVDGVSPLKFSLGSSTGGIGTYCHELGHILGLPDLYDLDGSGAGLGYWSVMALGNFLGAGWTPAHFDPWSKARLGFLHPILPTFDVDAEFPPVESEPVVYKLWRNGQPLSEYFLVENRRRIGSDAGILGAGLLVYHVDESQGRNSNNLRYMVGLEQADGLFQMNALHWGRNGGDDGDPFPGSSMSPGIGAWTTPDTRSFSGSESGVSIHDIVETGDRVRAHLRVTAGPRFETTNVRFRESAGDGDGFPEGGESGVLSLTVRNVGAWAEGVRFEAASRDPRASIGPASVAGIDIGPGEAAPPIEFPVDLGTSFTGDPEAVFVDLTLDPANDVEITRPLLAAVGSRMGLLADFEAGGEAGFVHGPVLFRPRTGGFTADPRDEWHLTSGAAHGGLGAWRCGHEGSGASRGIDAYLDTPVFLVPEDAVLSFHHRIDVGVDSLGPLGGGTVEISSNGAAWEPIAPIGGYPGTYPIPDRPSAAKNAWIGNIAAWAEARFDLSPYRGNARIRFRFLTNREEALGRGWEIDDVAVSATTPVRLLSLRAIPGPDGIRISFEVSPELRLAGADIERRRVGEEPAWRKVNESRIRPGSGSEGEFLDATATPGVGYRYRVVLFGADGSVVRSPEIEATRGTPDAGRARLLAPHPNPSRGGVSIPFTLPPSAAGGDRTVSISVLDVLGRKVKTLVDGPLPAGSGYLHWDGTDASGREAARGVYFILLETGSEQESRKVVVAR